MKKESSEARNSAALATVSAQALYHAENRGLPRIEALLRHLRATLPLA